MSADIVLTCRDRDEFYAGRRAEKCLTLGNTADDGGLWEAMHALLPRESGLKHPDADCARLGLDLSSFSVLKEGACVTVDVHVEHELDWKLELALRAVHRAYRPSGCTAGELDIWLAHHRGSFIGWDAW